jgi:hypothetical protein
MDLLSALPEESYHGDLRVISHSWQSLIYSLQSSDAYSYPYIRRKLLQALLIFMGENCRHVIALTLDAGAARKVGLLPRQIRMSGFA